MCGLQCQLPCMSHTNPSSGLKDGPPGRPGARPPEPLGFSPPIWAADSALPVPWGLLSRSSSSPMETRLVTSSL